MSLLGEQSNVSLVRHCNRGGRDVFEQWSPAKHQNWKSYICTSFLDSTSLPIAPWVQPISVPHLWLLAHYPLTPPQHQMNLAFLLTSARKPRGEVPALLEPTSGHICKSTVVCTYGHSSFLTPNFVFILFLIHESVFLKFKTLRKSHKKDIINTHKSFT